jgi:hypothetical protein
MEKIHTLQITFLHNMLNCIFLQEAKSGNLLIKLVSGAVNQSTG